MHASCNQSAPGGSIGRSSRLSLISWARYFRGCCQKLVQHSHDSSKVLVFMRNCARFSFARVFENYTLVVHLEGGLSETSATLSSLSF